MIVDDDLIAKFLSGEATPEEAVALHEWLKMPGNKSRFDELADTWNRTNPPKQLRAARKEEAWRKIKPARSFALPIGIAATILLVIGFWIFSTPAPELELVTTGDSTINIGFPDQSTAILNHNTSIEYPKEFEDDTRRINLISGEAFFSVTKDEKRPFVVGAGFSNIYVVGTEFNVQANNDAVEVAVNEGVVLVVTSSDSVYVRKGSAMIFRKAEKATPVTADENAWAYATKKLVFKDTPMSEVIKAVEKSYSVTISVSNDNIKKCTLNTTFDRYSVDKILLLISETLNLKLEQNGQVYTLEGDGCP